MKLRPTILMSDWYTRPARSWLLIGPAGVAELKTASLPWLPPEAVIDGENYKALALGLHTSRPLYDGQEPNRACSLRHKHDACYFTVSDTSATRLLRTWAETRDDAILWTALEHEYAKTDRLPPVTWFCRVCESAMAGPAAPADPICPACSLAGRITELVARRTVLRDRLENIEIELARLRRDRSVIEGSAA